MLLLIEKYLFYIFLFSIPFQTRKILYFDGWRFNEWQSVSVYFTDILLFILLAFWVFNLFSTKQHVARSTYYGKEKSEKPSLLTTYYLLRSPSFYLIAFLAVSAISIKNSDNFIISWYQWFKLIEFVVFYWYLSNYAFKKFGLFNSFLAIFLSGVVQAIVAIIQFLKQSSIGLKYLGESVFNNDFSGIASFYISDTEKIIRAYGTTPHPNVLAVFLLLSLFAFYFLFFNKKYSLTTYTMPAGFGISSPSLLNYTLLTTYAIILFAFFTTFSRTVIFVWFVTFCAMGIAIASRKNYRIILETQEGKRRVKAILIISLVAILLFGALFFHESISRLTISGNDQSIELRTFYAKEALKTDINLFGVGHGNFISWLIKENPFLAPYAYQPVHNVFLLIYSETGLLGISVFLLFLFFLVKNSLGQLEIRSIRLLLLACLLFISLFDHMFWTLQTGRLVFWFSLAVLTFCRKDDTMIG